jgi:hypothetical protein
VSNGFGLTPDDLDAQVTRLKALNNDTDGLVRSAGELARHLPKLGTAPPALHLAQRLRDAAGETGLTGEVTAASNELARFHEGLAANVRDYVIQNDAAARSFGRP